MNSVNRFDLIDDGTPVVTLWAGTADQERARLALIDLDGWLNYSLSVETVPALFGARHFLVSRETPVRVIKIVADVTAGNGVDLEDVREHLMEAVSDGRTLTLRRTRTRGTDEKVEELYGFISSVDEWAMRIDNSGTFTISVQCLDPYKQTSKNGTPTGVAL